MHSPVRLRWGATWLVVCLAVAWSGAAIAQVVVIVSAKSPIKNLTNNQISDIFLGTTKQFPSGETAVPLDLPEGSPLRDEFYAKFTGKTAAQVKSYWTKIIFTGRGLPPKEAPSTAAVRKAVADNPHAIGYIDPAAVDTTVKVLGSQ